MSTAEERKKDLALLEAAPIAGEAGGRAAAPKALVPKAADADESDGDEASSSDDSDDEVRWALFCKGLVGALLYIVAHEVHGREHGSKHGLHDVDIGWDPTHIGGTHCGSRTAGTM